MLRFTSCGLPRSLSASSLPTPFGPVLCGGSRRKGHLPVSTTASSYEARLFVRIPVSSCARERRRDRDTRTGTGPALLLLGDGSGSVSGVLGASCHAMAPEVPPCYLGVVDWPADFMAGVGLSEVPLIVAAEQLAAPALAFTVA